MVSVEQFQPKTAGISMTGHCYVQCTHTVSIEMVHKSYLPLDSLLVTFSLALLLEDKGQWPCTKRPSSLYQQGIWTLVCCYS